MHHCIVFLFVFFCLFGLVFALKALLSYQDSLVVRMPWQGLLAIDPLWGGRSGEFGAPHSHLRVRLGLGVGLAAASPREEGRGQGCAGGLSADPASLCCFCSADSAGPPVPPLWGVNLWASASLWQVLCLLGEMLLLGQVEPPFLL